MTISSHDNSPNRTTTPIGKVMGIISTAPLSLTGNRDEYFRVVGILEMVGKKEGDIFSLLQILKLTRHQ